LTLLLEGATFTVHRRARKWRSCARELSARTAASR
jgi:hypothetical protein